MERPFSHASIIDSTGAFPLSVLEQVIRWHVEKESQLSRIHGLVTGIQHAADAENNLDSKVNGILERVSITRVFDIDGLWEVLGEIVYDTGQPTLASGAKGVTVTVENDNDTSYKGSPVTERSEHAEQADEKPTRGVTPEIMDSEQDDDDDDDDLNTHHLPEEGARGPNITSSANTNGLTASYNPITAQYTGTPLTTEVVLVDNMTTLISDLFAKTEKSAAHKLLTHLARTLTSMTLSSTLTVFLLNTLAKQAPRKSSNNQDRQSSIFAAMTSTPSLGVIFDSFTDLHLLCHSLPSGVDDAERLYGADARLEEDDGNIGGEENSRTKSDRDRNSTLTGEEAEEILFTNVVEVLKDECPQPERWEGVSGDDRPKKSVNREQRWATFKITGGVGIINHDFG